MFCPNFKYRIAIISLYFAFPIFLFCQSHYQAQIFTLNDGLSSEICRSIFLDKAGFVWITTDKGLNRFDGNSFYTFRHRPNDPHSIANNSCHGIFQDSKGRIWINTDDGLSLFDEKKQTFENYFPDTTTLPFLGISYTEMAEDHQGRIWIGGYYDVLIFDPETKTFKKSGWYDYALRSGIIKTESRNSISQSVMRKSDTELWLMTVYGLFSVHTPSSSYTYYPNPEVDDYFAFALRHIDKEGILWIATYDQCFYTFDPKTKKWKHYTCPPKEQDMSDLIISIHYFDDQSLLMTRTDDVFLYFKKTGDFKKFDWSDKSKLLSYRGFTQSIVHKDKIYITTSGNQPFIKLTKKDAFIKKKKIPLPEGFVNNHSYNISDKKILTGDWDKNVVFSCDSSRCILLTEKNGNSELGNLQLFFKSRSGEYYFSTSSFVYKWNESQNTVQLISEKKVDETETEFRNFTEDNRGNIYIRERNKGIYVLKKEKEIIEEFHCGIHDGSFSALYYDIATDKLWLASEKNGLYIIDPQTRNFKNYPVAQLTKNKKGIIQDISGDKYGNVFLLIANRGLIRLNSSEMVPKLYTSYDGLQSDAVKYSCINNGIFWFTSESGLMAFDYKNERIYSFENEPENKLFNYRIFPDSTGNIVQNFYPQQILLFDTNAIKSQQGDTKIYLKEVKNSGAIIPGDSLFTVPYNQNNFVFLFGNFGNTGLNHQEHQYRINGQSWQPLENAVISLYNLTPGTYQIQVCNKYNLNDIFSFAVIVIPPWWKTKWFYALCVIFSFMIAFWAYENRISAVRKEEAEKNKLKQKISEIEMTALRAQMNPHFIFNCLNSINRFILVNDTDAASMYLTKFSKLIRLILDGSRVDFISLETELHALKLYIDMESMRFLDSFEWKIIVDPEISTDNIMLPPLLLQPYVENAIWHGLMQAPADYQKKLMIHVYPLEDNIVIEIIDNGIGRQKALEIKSKDGNKNKSHGITLSQERLKLMKKLQGRKAEIFIEDLYDAQQKPSGTRVKIIIQA